VAQLLAHLLFALDHAALLPFYPAWNGLTNTTHLVDWVSSNGGCVHAPSLSIGDVASILTPESLVEAYNITEGLQKQGMKASGSPIHEFH
jgi:hypothetical protein